MKIGFFGFNTGVLAEPESKCAAWKPVKATFQHVRCAGVWRVTVTYEGQQPAPAEANGPAVCVDRNYARCAGSRR